MTIVSRKPSVTDNTIIHKVGDAVESTVNIMANQAKVGVANAANAQVVEQPVETTATVEEQNTVSFFDSFDAQEAEAPKTVEDIQRELLASGECKAFKGLDIRNVNVTTRTADDMSEHSFVTFIVKQFVLGDVASDNTDAFGNPVMTIGRTHNIIVSSYAVSAAAKNNAMTALFANEIADGSDVTKALFIGGKIDVILHHVAAGVEYVNPFASNAEPVTFDRDRVIAYVTNLTIGELGKTVVANKISRY